MGVEGDSPCKGARTRIGIYERVPSAPDRGAKVARLKLLGVLAGEHLSEEILRPLDVRLRRNSVPLYR